MAKKSTARSTKAKQTPEPVVTVPTIEAPAVELPETGEGDDLMEFDDPLLTLTDAAKQLQRAPSTIHRWVKEQTIETVPQPNGLHRIRQATIDKYLLPSDPRDASAALIRLAKLSAQKAGDRDLVVRLNQVIDEVFSVSSIASVS